MLRKKDVPVYDIQKGDRLLIRNQELILRVTEF